MYVYVYVCVKLHKLNEVHSQKSSHYVGTPEVVRHLLNALYTIYDKYIHKFSTCAAPCKSVWPARNSYKYFQFRIVQIAYERRGVILQQQMWACRSSKTAPTVISHPSRVHALSCNQSFMQSAYDIMLLHLTIVRSFGLCVVVLHSKLLNSSTFLQHLTRNTNFCHQ